MMQTRIEVAWTFCTQHEICARFDTEHVGEIFRSHAWLDQFDDAGSTGNRGGGIAGQVIAPSSLMVAGATMCISTSAVAP